MRTVKSKYKAPYGEMGGFTSYVFIPSRAVPIDSIEPFIVFNHHGPQHFKPNNTGLPFGPHPHKGFETVTFIEEGSVKHEDSTGYKSVINAGGVQWMTAGKGIIHNESATEEFQITGGDMEISQLWINLPAKYKNAEPNYVGLQKENIPVVDLDNGKVHVHLVSGSWDGKKAPIQSLTDVFMSTINLKRGGKLNTKVPKDHNIFFFVVKGNITVNGETADARELVVFNNDDEDIQMEATDDSLIYFGHAKPNNERIVAHGPFVMNSEQEINQAITEYHQGKMGVWSH
ncbi:MAG TPA: pirin family protein [Flavipsychrobacter sp.]|nr:pirin family protein [Flavipsychrobacter sp.]